MSLFCTNCGTPLTEESKFCPNCGQPISVSESSQPSQAQYQSIPQAAPQQTPVRKETWQPSASGAAQNQNQYQRPQQTAYFYGVPNGYQNAAQNQQTWQQPGNAVVWQQPPKKKGKAGLIVGILALLLVGLAAVACFVWPGFLKKDSGETAPTTPTSVVTDTIPATTAASTESTVPTELTTVESTTTEPLETERLNPYLDVVDDDPCYAEFLWAYDNGLVEGEYLNGDHELTKGEVILLTWKAFGSPAADPEDFPFTDVTAADNCYPAMLWAYGNHIVTATSSGKFKPDNPMTRAQAISILCRTSGNDGAGYSRAYLDTEDDKYYYAPSNWAFFEGVVERDYYMEFRPADNILQADYLCWLARVLEPSLALDISEPFLDDFDYYGWEINVRKGETASFLAATDEDPSVRKHLTVTIEGYDVFEEAEEYPAKEGYEWRKVDFMIGYGDADADQYEYSLYCPFMDYYHYYLFDYYNTEQEDTGLITSWVCYQNSPWMVSDSELIVDYAEDGLYTVSYAIQVPIGYDGIVLRVNSVEAQPDYDEAMDDVYQSPEDYVFFRLD